MNNYKLIEAKLWNAISALASGVLTSLIYDAISSTSYILEFNGVQYVFASESISFGSAAGVVLGTFLLIWSIISVIIPLALKVKMRFTYPKINRINAKELVRTLDEAKKAVTFLYPDFFPETNFVPNSDLLKIYNRDLAKVITSLHSKFIPHNQKMKANILTFFRNPEYSSIITIDKSVSIYEFSSIIALLEKMVNRAKTNGAGDGLLEKDCAEMERNLEDLYELSRRVTQTR